MQYTDFIDRIIRKGNTVLLNSTSKITHYYKNVIEYSDLAEVSVLADPTGNYPCDGYTITQKNLLYGQIDTTTVYKLFDSSKDNVIDITIAFDAFKHSKKFKSAMWATASLKRDGTLKISDFPSYTISKSYLAPFVNTISVGSSWDEFANIQNSYRLTDIQEWSDYIQAIFSVKKELIKKIEIDFKGMMSEIKDTKHYIFQGNLIAKINTNILSMYQESSRLKNTHSMLSKKVAKVALQGNKYKKDARITLTSKLSGALPKSQFIPNIEQWKSIETVLKSKHGQMTAVQGPPGTGKTSLLQFVIASEVVNSVCNNASHPTLTTICSTNNQAVTNAVESLILDSSDRWLPTDVGLGMYVPARSDGVVIPNITINKSSKSNKVYINSDYLEPFMQWNQFSKIKETFIANARKNLQLNNNANLQEIEKKLKKKVLASQRKIAFSFFTLKIKNLLSSYLLSIFSKNDTNYYNSLKKNKWNYYLTLMKQSFTDALHYWEARFIEEIDALFTVQGKERKLAFKSSLDVIETISLLTPFIGMTLHQLAKHFGGANNPNIATESIGLLILDESGQICPETGFFSLLLAKKALVVGDSMQLEPIHSISENEDDKLIKKNRMKDFFKSSQGNFMNMADTAADYSTCLLEHYRCHSDIIAISNELCYQNKLVPKTTKDHGLYPPLSFLDIYGVCQKDTSGSLKNRDESDSIISWIFQERNKIEAYYKQDINNVIAVVTPFKKHADTIRQGLVKNGIKGVIVGTVHKLQGTEFPIVVFAPTYTIEYVRHALENKGKSMFFDISSSMINVAVSRAKKTFIYMGDPRILHYGNDNESLPSQILAKHLKKNAIALAFKSKDSALAKLRANIERIASLDAHRNILKQAFQDAQDCIVISSPFITKYAIVKDSIEKQICNAVERDVKVKIFYDSKLNSVRRHELKDSIQLLKQAGAEVIHKERLHSKVLYIDNKMIIESSFNWLSAVRDLSSEYQRYESSLVYRGELAAKMIADVEKEFLHNYSQQKTQ